MSTKCKPTNQIMLALRFIHHLYSSEARPKAERSELFLFSFLFLFQPPKAFSYVLQFHNLSKKHSEKTIPKMFFRKKKTQKNLFIFFFFRIFFWIFFLNFFFEFSFEFFFLCPKPTLQLFLSILLQFLFFRRKKKKIKKTICWTSTF